MFSKLRGFHPFLSTVILAVVGFLTPNFCYGESINTAEIITQKPLFDEHTPINNYNNNDSDKFINAQLNQSTSLVVEEFSNMFDSPNIQRLRAKVSPIPQNSPLNITNIQKKSPVNITNSQPSFNITNQGNIQLPIPTIQVENSDNESEEDQSTGQITNVFQFSDVKETDWAFKALKHLIERYQCLVGYPNTTFRGNQSLTRYEFAAGLNSCIQTLEKLIIIDKSNFVTIEDLQKVRKLQEEFTPELEVIRERLTKLEDKTSGLEGSKFSTTTKIFGQTIFGVQGRSSGKINIAGFCFKCSDNDQINVISNTQLTLFTQFSPTSILITGLQIGTGDTGTPRLTNDVAIGYEGNSQNNVNLSDLTYRQLINNNFAVIVGPTGINPVNVFRGTNRIESAGFGPLSRLSQRNPIINIGNGSAGVGFDWQIGTNFSLQALYSISGGNDANLGGLFGGTRAKNTTGVQVVWSPSDQLDIAFQYLNSYSPDGFLGTGVGDDQLALPNNLSFLVPLQTNAFGTTLEWRVNPNFSVGGWVGYTTSSIPGESGTVETINWMSFLSFPNLFGRGNLGGVFIGQPPKIINSNFNQGRNVPSFITNGDFTAQSGGQPDSTLNIEVFYRWRLEDNIALTPGFIVILNPRHNAANDNIIIGVMRTTFSF